MEKMGCQLSDVVPLLMNQNRSAKTISFGPIAVQLLVCVQAIQERKHVVVDVKPDNFMLADGSGKGSTVAQKLASRIRILDLALVQPWSSIGCHRTNEGSKGLAGTPLYASLSIHNGETPSRRDDLEALGYVIAELIMRLFSGNTSKELPWSHGKSDEEIGAMKEEYVNDSKSDFYKQLGGASVVKVFNKYMDEVRGYSFKKTPDYEALSQILMDLKIPVPSAKKAAAAAPKKASKTRGKTTNMARPASSVAGTKRTTRSQNAGKSTEESPKKMARDASHMETIEIDDSDEESWTDAQQDAFLSHGEDGEEDGDSYATAMDLDHTQDENGDSYSTAMDLDQTQDENEEPDTDAKPKALVGVTILVEGGPHKGLAVNLIQGRSETIIVGRNPTASPGKTILALTDDSQADDSHIRLDLGVSKKLVSVTATDLKSSGGSFVGSEKIRKGKDYKLFRGGSVRIGSSLLKVKTLDPNKVASTPQEKRAAATKKVSRKQRVSPVSEEPEETPETEVPRLKRRGVRLVVTEGPHKGESFELEHGGIDSYNIGSKPSGKTGDILCLNKDDSLQANHVRLDLVVTKKLTTVTVTDKSKGGTMVNRDSVNKGRAFISDKIKIGNSVLQIKTL
jgi:pSer/pThr/pTyr-binding forkhead associated (FHA) protein